MTKKIREWLTPEERASRTCACGTFVVYGRWHACDLGAVPARFGPTEISQPCVRCGYETKNKRACPSCFTAVVFVPPPKKAKPDLESKIKADIRKALVAEGVLCWVHNVDNRSMSTGLGLGTSDLICVVPPFGRFLGIEIKRPGYEPSRVSDDQRAWLAVVRQFHGVSGIATSVSEALALVHEARQECRIHADPSRA